MADHVLFTPESLGALKVQFLALQVQVRDSHSSIADGFSTFSSARTKQHSGQRCLVPH